MDNKKDMDIVYLEDEEMSGKILSSLRSRVDDIIFLALGTTLEKYHAAVIDAVREY